MAVSNVVVMLVPLVVSNPVVVARFVTKVVERWVVILLLT